MWIESSTTAARWGNLLNAGAAKACPNNDCGPRWNKDRDGRGRGGWEIPYVFVRGSSYEPIGPSTRPPGPPPRLIPPGPRPPGAGSGNHDPYGIGNDEGQL